MLCPVIFHWQGVEELPFSLKCNRAFLLLFPGHGSCPLDAADKSGKGRAVIKAPAAGGHFCLASSIALASETMDMASEG